MSKITLTKEIKIRLLNAIKDGEMDTDEFPELTLDAPNMIDVKTLTFGQLNAMCYGREEKAFIASTEEGRKFLSTYDIGRDFLKHYNPNNSSQRLPKWFFESEEERKEKDDKFWKRELEH